MKKLLPYIALVLGLVYAVKDFLPSRNKGEFDLESFARLPLLSNGRIKPIDTVARTALLQFQGRQTVTLPSGQGVSAEEWFADVIFATDAADGYQVFEIVHEDVLTLFGLRPSDGAGNKRFSFKQLSGGIDEMERQYNLTVDMEDNQRSTFQKAVVRIRTSIASYQGLRFSFVDPESANASAELIALNPVVPQGVAAVQATKDGKPADAALVKQLTGFTQGALKMQKFELYSGLRPVPPDLAAGQADWMEMGDALLDTFRRGKVSETAMMYAALGQSWKTRQPAQFNKVIGDFRAKLAAQLPAEMDKVGVETRYNAAAAFYKSMVLYVFAFLLAITSWLKWPDTLRRTAFWLVVIAFALATLGIGMRMWLESRPPVTNLYSSALFIGWGAVALCIVLESIYKNAIGSVAAGIIGFSTLLIAYFLSLDGDTLEMMRAVLDSNFWLATHVVVVTAGYASTYLAGFLAIIYILRGVLTRSLDKATADSLGRMVYGIVCFATLFSLVGTVLGGIWADQSWGRFWGWDPKENGALIIVIWNAIILHARWGGMVRQRGMMCLAVGGNIVTSWSWFGVNMLEVGLHSYGFMAAAFPILIGFVISQIAIIAIGNLPLENWRSFAKPVSEPAGVPSMVR